MLDVTTTVSLTDREEGFILGLAHGLRPTRAAKEAGWSTASATHLLAKPHVSAAIRAITGNMNRVLKRIEAAEQAVAAAAKTGRAKS